MADSALSKLGEVRYKLWHDVCWKLEKIRYSLPSPTHDRFDLVDEVEAVIDEIEKIRKDIETYVQQEMLDV